MPPAFSLDGCWNVYLDCGSNIGVQVRKLFEPGAFANASVQPHFKSLFGTWSERRNRACAVGFEPNPYHSERLEAIQTRYAELGLRATFLSRTAVGTRDGEALFYFDTSAEGKAHEQWGAGLIPFAMNQGRSSAFHNSSSVSRHVGKRTKVRIIDLASWIERYVLRRQLPPSPPPARRPALVMKMDIEDSEVEVLPRLLHTRVLCAFTTVFIEYHARFLRGTRAEVSLRWPVEFAANASRACPETEFLRLDDETYLHDGVPLPRATSAADWSLKTPQRSERGPGSPLPVSAIKTN